MKLRSWYVYTVILALVIPLTAAAEMVGEGSFDRNSEGQRLGFARCANGIRIHLASQGISRHRDRPRARTRRCRMVQRDKRRRKN